MTRVVSLVIIAIVIVTIFSCGGNNNHKANTLNTPINNTMPNPIILKQLPTLNELEKLTTRQISTTKERKGYDPILKSSNCNNYGNSLKLTCETTTQIAWAIYEFGSFTKDDFPVSGLIDAWQSYG